MLHHSKRHAEIDVVQSFVARHCIEYVELPRSEALYLCF
ncbi:hypothetical protein SF83666_c23270 [Sinorhizobium fredii CCBAU 83666]|nr:hypothetical protein SF83666_c23270 [Sinorhizobium fredii CCBAU 83666]